MKNQKGFAHWVIVILISVMAVGLVGAAWWYEENKENNSNITTTNTTVNINNVTNNTNSIINEVPQSVNNCMTSSDPTGCLIKLSLDNNDINICEEILNVSSPFSDQLQYLRDGCVYDRLIENPITTVSDCENILSNNDYYSSSCKNHLSHYLNDEKLCNSDGCIRLVAVQKNNVDLCNSIVDTNHRNWCLGIVTEDVEYCDNIIDGSADWWPFECKSHVGILKNDATICENITVDKSFKSVCLALLKNKLDYCQGDYFCITQIAMIKEDVEICNTNFPSDDELSSLNNSIRNNCIALATRDTSICDSMDSTVYKEAKHTCRVDVNYLNANGIRYVRGNYID